MTPGLKRAIESFCKALGEVLTRATGDDWNTRASENPAPVWNTPVMFALQANDPPTDDVPMSMSQEHAAALVAKILGVEDESAEFDADQLPVVEGLLQEAAPALFSHLGGNVAASVRSLAAMPPELAGPSVTMIAEAPGLPPLTFVLQFPESFVRNLESQAQSAARSVEAGHGQQPNLSLVMDVELNVTIRFGRREMSLREMMALGSGSIIELDRHASDPVDLLLDDRVIARGEVVIVDGNYGLRVTEVLTQERPGMGR